MMKKIKEQEKCSCEIDGMYANATNIVEDLTGVKLPVSFYSTI